MVINISFIRDKGLVYKCGLKRSNTQFVVVVCVIRQAQTVENLRIVWGYLKCFVQVFDRPFELTEIVVTLSTVHEEFSVGWVLLNCELVLRNCLVKVF